MILSASGLTLVSGGHDVIDNSPLNAPIHIGDRVWCGVNVTILAGVSIGDDVVIAAGSVVVSDIPSNSLAAGVPAVVKKTLDRSNVKQYWSLWGSGNGKDE